jgi:ribosomal protein S27AE
MPTPESLFHKQLILCPRCGSEENATLWDIVNAQSDPDLKERLLRKVLQSHECANCGEVFVLAEPMAYHDPDRRLLIAVLPVVAQDDRRDKAPLPPDPLVAGRMALAALGHELDVAEGYTLRLVTDYNHLIEKIHLADHGRSDRVIEVLKVAVRRNPSPGAPVSGIEEMLYLTERDGVLLFMIRDGEGAWLQMELDAAIYDNVEHVMGETLRDDGEWAVIDTAYAVEVINSQA